MGWLIRAENVAVAYFQVHFRLDFITEANIMEPIGYKTFFILNSAEHGIYPAHKC